MKDLKFYQKIYDRGYDAWVCGVRTVEEAKLANPYRLFDFQDHARAVSWNRGWNAAKKEHDHDSQA